jgi:hypothetical protein
MTETNVDMFYDDYVFMDMTETNLISVVHLLCLVHLPILYVVDACKVQMARVGVNSLFKIYKLH